MLEPTPSSRDGSIPPTPAKDDPLPPYPHPNGNGTGPGDGQPSAPSPPPQTAALTVPAGTSTPVGPPSESLLLPPDLSDLDRTKHLPRPVSAVIDFQNPRESNASVTFASSAADPPLIPQDPGLPGRRSVQFARSENGDGPIHSHSRQPSWDEEQTGDQPGKQRPGAGFMAKLKSLAVTTGMQTPKAESAHGGQWSAASSPVAPKSRAMSAVLPDHNGSDADADVETADEGTSDPSKARKKKKTRRPRPQDTAFSVPTTPAMTHDGTTEFPITAPRLGFLRRRATMADTEDHRAGLSEGEGREHLARRFGHVRGQSWLGVDRTMGDGEGSDRGNDRPRRAGHLRSLTVLGGGGMSDADQLTPRKQPLFSTGERATTYGVNKWQQMKNTLRALRPPKEKPLEHLKSAELLAELRAGAPAVLMLASMLQRDEHGHKRIPVLLEQLNLHISDSTPADDDEDRHWIFTIKLEYGSGPFRMKWLVKRTIRDILNLHFRYKIALNNDKYLYPRLSNKGLKQPKFPLSSFPYLRNVRELEDSDNDDDQSQAPQRSQSVYAPSVRAGEETAGEATAGEQTGAEQTASDTERAHRPRKKRSKINMLATRRRSTVLSDAGGESVDPEIIAQREAAAKRKFIMDQRRMLEKYLLEMVRWLMFRADSNRLCRFFELSALGVRLAAEGSYHGKECYLHIQSCKSFDIKSVLSTGKVTSPLSRPSRKWFLVRQSYVVCVESPENMNIHDVYLVDNKFRIASKRSKLKQISDKAKGEIKDIEIDLAKQKVPGKHHTLSMYTSELKVKLFARNQAIVRQFEESILEMLKHTQWNEENRFGSFAPVRHNIHAQWLVDGRDYMWNVSRALSLAKDVIYIHDWWLSPELYMRRPPAISQKWRLDRILQRKAKEGVKVFIIVYRNVEAAVPIDSEYTKYSLLNLHPNVFVQRSPHQVKKNQFFYAHHEKVVIVDHDVAFLGGIDLCFGRWDCPQHPIADDRPTGFEEDFDPKDAGDAQFFPGKDYSNPRVSDFVNLHEPYAEMYDRTEVPRMPWHDVSMQVVGQPARDLTRHFVQRWNYIRRNRNPTRPTPFLLPPPDLKPDQFAGVGLAGTCEVQILRSSGPWSSGTQDIELSIQAAYVKMIEESEHFIYMENQFFVTSTNTLNTTVENRIGDALVERIKRAHALNENWKCFIVIPLMPGFQAAITENQGSSVRIILQLQYRSICRGEQSIFGRLRAAGIEPEEYIQFFSLRSWGKIGKTQKLATEQLYVHAKIIIVDDRVALIGSANINERSMLGNRDSEAAAIVRDIDMITSSMGGKPYMVGRFAHTLRLRLMREHLGIDVDAIIREERMAQMDRDSDFGDMFSDELAPDELAPEESGDEGVDPHDDRLPTSPVRSRTFNYDVDLEDLPSGQVAKGKEVEPGDARVVGNKTHEREVEGYGQDHWKTAQLRGLDAGRDSVIVDGREVLVNDIAAEGRGTLRSPSPGHHRRHSSSRIPDVKTPPIIPPSLGRSATDQAAFSRPYQVPHLPALDDIDFDVSSPLPGDDGPSTPNPLTADIKQAYIDRDCMRDPLIPGFYRDVWNRVAENNSKIFRRIFRCQPDSEVQTFSDYQTWETYAARFRNSMDPRNRTSSASGNENSRPGTTSTGTPANGAAVDRGNGLRNTTSHPKLVVSGSQGSSSGNWNVDVPPYRPGSSPGSAQKGLHTPTFKVSPSEQELSIPSPQKTFQDAPSPILQPGDTPFPVFESGTANGMLQAQASGEAKQRRATFTSLEKPDRTSMAQSSTSNLGNMKRGRRRATTRGSRREFMGNEELLTKEEAEMLLEKVQGVLVEFPYDWLYVEENKGSWLHGVDSMAPVAIYD